MLPRVRFQCPFSCRTTQIRRTVAAAVPLSLGGLSFACEDPGYPPVSTGAAANIGADSAGSVVRSFWRFKPLASLSRAAGGCVKLQFLAAPTLQS